MSCKHSLVKVAPNQISPYMFINDQAKATHKASKAVQKC